ncbi:endonuclease NucS [Candidatus Micrarchaeota archaeon]|nr:endonuclease NucS [Candidatus Micrarchaeota archaeon]
MELMEAQRVVNSALEEGAFTLLVGSCRVRYEGRAASKLSEGDRVVLIKNDGTFLVHQTQGMTAINYQGPGAVVSTRISRENGEEALVISAVRKKRTGLNERIDVHFFNVYSAHAFSLKDDQKLKLFGSERELSDLLMQDLHLIEKGLIPLQQESEMRKGTIDILAEDRDRNLVVIEVKRREAGLDAVSQLSRYVQELSKRKGKHVRGILCSPHVTPNALKMLEHSGLEYFKLEYEIRNPSAKIKGLQRKQKTMDAFFE